MPLFVDYRPALKRIEDELHLVHTAVEAIGNPNIAESLIQLVGIQARSADAVERIADTLDKLYDLSKSPPNPGVLHANVTSEENGVMKFRVAIPAFPDPIGDVVKGELTVTANGSTQVIDISIGQTEVTDLVADEGTTAEMSYVLVDDAGNKSEIPAVFNLAVADTIAPPNPGALDANVTGE